MQLGESILYRSGTAQSGSLRDLSDLLLLTGVPLLAIVCAAAAASGRRKILTFLFAAPLVLLNLYHFVLTLSRLA